ncbi:MAG: metalloregulator ArsR/SmtB family transcription factor [Flavobacteriales bacterium]|nr:metalloregulator ArsR/SmtB family transcription factor [Flavobacteriales bacterium]
MLKDRLSLTFSALADPTRRAILARLSRGAASVNDLAAPFSMSLPAISKHLKVLERAQLITRGKEAQWRPCELKAEPLREVDVWIEQYRQMWEERFDRLDAYLMELQAKSADTRPFPQRQQGQKEKAMNKAAIFNFIVEKDADRSPSSVPSTPAGSGVGCWTNADILCKWWAPKPYVCVIKSLDFREGGRWLYYMQGPQGDRHWCFFDYETVRPKSFYSGSDGFCDEHGVANSTKPKVSWEAHFSKNEDRTLVRVILRFGSPEELEQIVRMGFKEGFTMGLDQLDELLAERTN